MLPIYSAVQPGVSGFERSGNPETPALGRGSRRGIQRADYMRAVFLDRDGVINEDRDDYVKNLGDLKVYPFVPESIRRLNNAHLPVFVISNQQGVAKGLIAEEDLQAIQRQITQRVEAAGGHISAFYYCRHLASDDCPCRKPRPGMLLEAAKEHGIDLADSVMVGDSECDVLAGKAAGCRTVLLLSGHAAAQDLDNLASKPDHVASNLSEATEYIVSLDGKAPEH